MGSLIRRSSKKSGLPPGTIVHTGEDKDRKVKITVLDYNEKDFDEQTLKTLGDCKHYEDGTTTTWINIDGVHDIKIIEEFGQKFNIDSLVLEDIASTDQRPKVEESDNYLFIVARMFYYDKAVIKSEQISIILKKNCMITFQQSEGDVFNPIRERLRINKGAIRKRKADYLAYSLLDAIVDNYFIVLEKFGEQIELVETKLTSEPKKETLREIHSLKYDVIFLRKATWPLREVVNQLIRNESKVIQPGTIKYLRDLYDHTIHVIDTIEAYRDILSSMVDLYLSSISNKMNEIMKVLTVIATIFIPLTFITGLYGMNFKYMPELESIYGYPAILLVMVIVGGSMYLYFRKKQWV